MKQKGKKAINVALYGMDERSYKTMEMYLKGPCRGVAIVVDPWRAEVDIFDADFATARDIFDERRKITPDRPIIAMSLEDLRLENTIFLKKPVTRDGMLTALDQAKKQVDSVQHTDRHQQKKVVVAEQNAAIPARLDKSEWPVKQEKNIKKTIDREEQKKTAKHQTARQINEGGFLAFIGILSDIDFEDREQILTASYDLKKYFQGYVMSAFKVAKDKAKIVQLNSAWKPVLIFPKSHEVLLDADEQQLRAFAGMKLNRSANTGLSLSAVDMSAAPPQAFDKFVSMDAFLWKLAILTSKGRYPLGIEIEKPVYLKAWPNLTRMVVTPHAIRIAALLIKAPRTMLNIAEVLNIKPQYVFVFISASFALGLAGQARRQVDQSIAQNPVKPTKSTSLFKKIMTKLRASKLK